MKTHAQWWAGTTLLALGLWYLAVGDRSHAADDKATGGVAMSEDEFKKLVASSVKNIQKALSEKPDKKNTLKAQTAAVMIAAYAQYAQGGPSAADKASLRDAALKLADTIAAGKVDDAKKQTDGLAAAKADPAAKTEPVPILAKSKLDLAKVMRQFGPVVIGGYGIEDRLKKMTALGNKLPEAQMSEEFVLTLLQIATIAALAKDNPPSKNPAGFVKLSEDFRVLATTVADASRMKEGPKAAATLYKMTIHCNKCHDKYRND